MIPVFRPSYGEEELEAVKEVFESGWIGLGPKTEEFEKAFAEYVGAKHAVAVNSGTAALHLALLAHGIGPGMEVIVPTITFVSTAHAVVYCGAKPVFADVEEDTLTIDFKDAGHRATWQTVAMIPVHYAGHPCGFPPWITGPPLFIEDAAHACGAQKIGQMVGSLQTTCFSFHAVKNLATGDGGMITTNDKEIAQRLRRLRWCGITKGTWQRTKEGGGYGWAYQVTELGYKLHMNDITAAIGLVQLRKLDEMNARRRDKAKKYTAYLSHLGWLETPVEHSWARSSWHAYVIKTDHRDALREYLRMRGISTGVHYIPLHLQPYYRDPGVSLPVAERVWKRLLTLPLYPDLTIAEQERVIKAILDFGEEKL